MTQSNDPPPTQSNAVASQDNPPKSRSIAPQTAGVEFLGTPPVMLRDPASLHLLALARSLAAKSDADLYRGIVVIAHAACEVHTDYYLQQLLDLRTDKVLAKLVAPDENEIKSLAIDDIYEIYVELTGDHARSAQWWGQWKVSRKDRHRAAHRGEQMTAAEVTRAIDYAQRYMDHMTAHVGPVLERLRKNPI